MSTRFPKGELRWQLAHVRQGSHLWFSRKLNVGAIWSFNEKHIRSNYDAEGGYRI